MEYACRDITSSWDSQLQVALVWTYFKIYTFLSLDNVL